MLVEKLEYQKKNPSRVNIFFESGEVVGLHSNIVVKYDLRKGIEIDPQSLHKAVVEDLKIKLVGRCDNKLSKSRTTQKGLEIFIDKKVYEWDLQGIEELSDIKSELIAYYKGQKLIDDEAFTIDFINSRLKSKPRSLNMIRSELYQKGIHNNVLQIASSIGVSDYELLENFNNKKFNGELIDLNDKKKMRTFANKGFNFSIIKQLSNDLVGYDK